MEEAIIIRIPVLILIFALPAGSEWRATNLGMRQSLAVTTAVEKARKKFEAGRCRFTIPDNGPTSASNPANSRIVLHWPPPPGKAGLGQLVIDMNCNIKRDTVSGILNAMLDRRPPTQTELENEDVLDSAVNKSKKNYSAFRIDTHAITVLHIR